MSLISDMETYYSKTADETLMMAQYRWFSGLGYSTGGINQVWTEWLNANGYPQAFPECQNLYFQANTGLTQYQAAMNAFYAA